MSTPAESDSKDALPKICLNMIVRNEAHIVHEVLDCVAQYISYWVIVDTGSDDGTQDVIRNHMAELGIPGELHESEWKNFGVNRSEALDLAQGHADYIWVIDADDLVVGTPDFSNLTADAYELRFGDMAGFTYWRAQVLKDGIPWRYLGVVHEYIESDQPFDRRRLPGEFFIDSRRLGGRNLDPQKYARDRDLLLAEMERDANDSRSAFYLAQSYYDLGDFANAREWYARRAEMGGWDEEVYYSKLRVAESMSRLEMPWPEVLDAFLQAWENRPSRAEALFAIANRYRTNERYQLAYIFAERAAQIPLPHNDRLFVGGDVHNWRALDEQAVCASWLGRPVEAFSISRRLITRADLPEHDRTRITANRDLQSPHMIGVASVYPDQLSRSLSVGPRESEVTVSLIAGPDRTVTEHTLNSFLNCCLDRSRIGRFLVVNAGLSAEDRATLIESYRFLEFVRTPTEEQPGGYLTSLQREVGGPFWLHLDEGWQFFAQDNYISRLTGVLAAEPDVYQVAINFEDAVTLTGRSAAESSVRRTERAGRYVLTDTVASGPAMCAMARLGQAAGLHTATLDEVLCIAPGKQVLEAVAE